MINEVHVGMIFAFRFTVSDADGVIDLSGATTKTLIIERPDDTLLTLDMDFYTDGTDGKVQYITIVSDLNQKGLYKYQLYFEMPDGSNNLSLYSDINNFRVWPNLGE